MFIITQPDVQNHTQEQMNLNSSCMYVDQPKVKYTAKHAKKKRYMINILLTCMPNDYVCPNKICASIVTNVCHYRSVSHDSLPQ